MSTSPSTSTKFTYDASHQNQIWGTIALILFIFSWLASLASPIIIITLIIQQQITYAVILISIIVLCYVIPFQQTERIRSFFSLGSTKYFRSSSLTYDTNVLQNLQKKKNNQLLCVHPHGIFCMGWSILFGRGAELAHIKFCFSTALYNSPFFRVLSKLIGNPMSADKNTFMKLMSKGNSLALIPGGFESASIHSSTQPRVHVSKKGFIKYALVYGYELVPVYVFNEHKTYHNAQGFYKFRFWLNSFGLPGIIPFGKWWCPLLPKSEVDIHIVVGKGLQLPVIAKPTREEVELWHGIYVKYLIDVYDTNKNRFGEKKSLEVW